MPVCPRNREASSKYLVTDLVLLHSSDFIAIEGSPLATLVSIFVGLVLLLADEWIRRSLARAALQNQIAELDRAVERLLALEHRADDLERKLSEFTALQDSLQELIVEFNALKSRFAESGGRV